MEKEQFLSQINKLSLPQQNLQVINNALQIADRAHFSFKRLAGAPYIEHVIDVASVLASWNSPYYLIAAGLLHDVMNSSYSTPPTLEEIRNACDEKVELLVSTSTEISRFGSLYPRNINYQQQHSYDDIADTFPEIAETLGKAPLVFVLRIANHLENSKSIGYLEKDDREIFARFGLNVLAPLSSRLGMDYAKRSLEDISFSIIDLEAYDRLIRRYSNEKVTIATNPIITTIQKYLYENRIEAKVELSGRSFFSIYKKWLENGSTENAFPQTESAYPFLVIVNSKAECYHSLGILHSLYSPITTRFNDYIASPKNNDYQALHTGLRVQPGVIIDVIIRSSSMQQIAENGITAKWANQFPETGILITAPILDPEQIQVFTPNGELKPLPTNSTPVDFAFSIHKEIGFQCVGAITNGKHHDLEQPLEPLSSVQVIASGMSIGPKTQWLRSAKTKLAISEIQKYYQIKESNELIDRGREILNNVLAIRKISYPFPELMERINVVCNKLGSTIADILVDISQGAIEVDSVCDLLTYENVTKLTSDRYNETFTIITIISRDRTGLAADITAAASKLDIGLETFDAHRTSDNISRARLTVGEVPLKKIEQLIAMLKEINGVLDVSTLGRQSIPMVESEPYTMYPAYGYRFKGRQKELGELVDAIENLGEAILIWGPRRIGKTSLIGEIPNQLNHGMFLPITINLQAREIGSTLDLIHMIINRIADSSPNSNPPKWSTLKKNPLYTFDNFINRTLPDRKTVIITIDEFQLFEKLAEYRESARLSKQDLILFFRNLMQKEKKMGLILSGGGILKKLTQSEDISSLLELTRFMELHYLSREDAARIITETNFKYESQAIERILDITSNSEKTGNHPGYVQIICFELSRIYGHFISLQNVETWLKDHLHKLPEHYFSNLWGFSLGFEKTDLPKCLAVLLTIALKIKEEIWIREEDILDSKLTEYLSRSNILKALNQLESIRSISKTTNSGENLYTVKMPLAVEWLNNNFTLEEIFLDNFILKQF